MRRPYDSRLWRNLRLEVLAAANYRCGFDPECTRPADAVDHIVPWREAPHLAFDVDNLRAICTFHNSQRVKKPNRVGTSRRRPSAEWQL